MAPTNLRPMSKFSDIDLDMGLSLVSNLQFQFPFYVLFHSYCFHSAGFLELGGELPR